MTSPCLEGPDRSRKAEEQACETIEKGDSASDDHRRTPRGAHSIRRTPGKPAPRQRKAFRPSRPQFRSRARLHQAPGEHRRRPLAAPRRYARQVTRTKTMLAVHLENGAVTLRDVPVPERPAGFALLRLLAGGICNTDLELQRGYYGVADTLALEGKRVVGEINLACTNCDWCRKGLGRHCPNRTVLGIVNHPGAFAE